MALVILTMFVIVVVAGYLTGGSLKNLAHVDLKHLWLFFLSFAVRVPLLIESVQKPDFVLAHAGAFHMVSYGLLTVGVLVNFKVRGMPVLGLGMALNFIVSAVNGGFMPAPLEHLEQVGGLTVEQAKAGHTMANSVVASKDTVLPWLGDIFISPKFFGRQVVFSIGDIILAAGACIFFLSNMRTRKRVLRLNRNTLNSRY